MSQALQCGKHVFASRITCVCQINAPIAHAVHFHLTVLLRCRWVTGERTWFLLLRSHVVTLFLACDRFPVVPCHLTDHFWFALLRSRWWWSAVRRVGVVEYGTQMHSQVSHSPRVLSCSSVSWCLSLHSQQDVFPVFMVSLVV